MKIDETEIMLDLDGVVTWQYDKSPTLLSLLEVMKSLSRATFSDFLNNFKNFVIDIGNIGTGGDIDSSSALAIWGIVTGLPRPSVMIDGESTPISDDLYKRLLSARLHQMYSPGSITAIESFISEVFGDSVYIIDNNDMTISIITREGLTDEESALINSDDFEGKVLELPIGVGTRKIGKVTGQFGLNITESEGQNLENFAQSQGDNWGGSLS